MLAFLGLLTIVLLLVLIISKALSPVVADVADAIGETAINSCEIRIRQCPVALVLPGIAYLTTVGCRKGGGSRERRRPR